MDAQTEFHRSQYRLPMAIANWLKMEATANFRSVNAELIAILHEAMQRRLPRKVSVDRSADHTGEQCPAGEFNTEEPSGRGW